MYVFYGDVWLATVIAVISAGVLLLSKYLARNDDYWAKRGVHYAPRQSLWTVYKSISSTPIHELLLQNREKYGKLFGSFELFTEATVVVGDAEVLRDILVKDFHIFPYRRELFLGDPMMDNMVSMMNGEDWKRVRTIITPAFTSKRMRAMGSIINECSNRIIQTLNKHFQKKEPVDCKSVFGGFTLDVIASAAFATKIDSLNDPDNVFVTNARESFLEFSAGRVFVAMLCPRFVVSLFRLATNTNVPNFFKGVIQKVIEKRKQSGQRFNDVLQILMDALEETRSEDVDREHSELLHDDVDQYGSVISEKDLSPNKYKKLSETELLSQCVLFFTVGYETSASALAFLSYCLALNPDWQERLIKEVDEAFGKNKEMSYDTVRDMKVLDAMLAESLRMFPPVLASERTCIEEYKLGDTGITLERGMRISFPIVAMHLDPDYFEDPHTFNPERFMTSDPRHPPYAYLPFGAEPRNCLGMRFAVLEIKLCITNVLRHYRFKKAPETKVPLEFKKGLGFMSVEKLHLAVEKRTDVQN